MKILLLTNKMPFPPRDGGAIATLNMATELAKNGCQITILAQNTPKHHFPTDHIPSDLKMLIRFYSVNVNTTYSYFKALKNLFFSDLPYNAERFISEEYDNALKSLLIAEPYDIVQIEGLYMSFYIETIKKYSNAFVAFRSHNIEHEIWNRTAKKEKSFFKKNYFKLLSKRILSLEIKKLFEYEILISITQRDADFYLKSGYKKKLIVCPAGVDLASYPNQHIIIRNSLFYIGGLDWIPNQQGLLWFLKNVWPAIHAKFPDLILNIAGRNASEKFKKAANFPNVHFYGEIEDSKKFMEENGIMIIPLFAAGGMRIKIIEGMACAKPIISTTTGAEGISVNNGENIIIANHREDFIKAIEALLTDTCLFKNISVNAQKFVLENYDNKKIIRTLSDFYQNCMNIK